MIIEFKTRQLEKCCNIYREAVRMWGEPHSKKIYAALDQIKASHNLADVYSLPNLECHELSNNRQGQFAITTKQPFRLVFEPSHDPVPLKEGGGVDRVLITDILVLEVEDYHGKRK